MDTQLKKVLERSLQDPVPAIRTNATVCLGLLSTTFTKSKVTQLCLPSFTRALRDNFPHNRERALHSIKSTLDLYTTVELGTKILPHVSAVSFPLVVVDDAMAQPCF
jgi:SCY1-like protein 1